MDTQEQEDERAKKNCLRTECVENVNKHLDTLIFFFHSVRAGSIS